MFQHSIEHQQGTCTTQNTENRFSEQHQDVATSVTTSTQT